MVEYRDNGEPIPDGRVTVEISLELAYVWDPGNRYWNNYTPPYEPKQTYVFEFKDVRSLREDPNYFVIGFPLDRGDRANTLLKIPWSQILSIQVNCNSSEYVAEAREWNNGRPQEFFDTRFGGKCIGCASSS